MAKRMKTITAGPVTKTVVYSMPAPRDPEHVRAAKRKASTAARRAMNYKSAVANLELLIAANFGGADLFFSRVETGFSTPSFILAIALSQELKVGLDRLLFDAVENKTDYYTAEIMRLTQFYLPKKKERILRLFTTMLEILNEDDDKQI